MALGQQLVGSMAMDKEIACTQADGGDVTDDSTDIFPLLDLPEVVVDKLISFLPPRSCLILRSACKTTYSWINNKSIDKQEIKKWDRFFFRITGKGSHTFESAVKLNLPITVFHLKNKSSKDKIYESKGVTEFIELNKNRPLSLIVDVLFMFQTTNEQTFYSSFGNITELVANISQTYFSVSKDPELAENEDYLRSLILVPPPKLVSSLKTLTIKDCEHSPLLSNALSDEFIVAFISGFKNLKALKPPAKLKKLERPGLVPSWFWYPSRKRAYCPEWVDSLSTAITANEWSVAGKEGKKKAERLIIDLNNFARCRFSKRAYLSYGQNYVKLLQQAHERNILLRFVYPPVLEMMYTYWQDLGWSANAIHDSFGFLDSIESMLGVGNALLLGFRKMLSLERLSICHTFARRQWLNQDPEELSWDNLKTLKVIVHICETGLTDAARETWNFTFHRIFENAKRSSVTNLILKVNACSALGSRVMDPENILFQAPVIISNFTCLQNLTICGWMAPRATYHALFSGLPKLKYVWVASCYFLDDVAFSFLSVVKTVILNLDKMPYISEQLFTHILCHMPLKELRILGSKPVKQLTPEALKALQEGTFGRTIEHFPFTWKSYWIKEKEKNRLEKEFRSMSL